MSADAPINVYQQPVQLRVRVPINLRDAPTRAGRLVGRRPAGELLLADQLLDAETYLDTSFWYRLTPSNWFVWAGGVEEVVDTPSLVNPPVPLRVRRRADNTIRPLDADELMRIYGPFSYQNTANGAITIDPPWEAQQIVRFNHPLLARMDLQSLRIHRLAATAFREVFDAVQAAGPDIADRLITCAGTYVPRHIRRDARRPLSSHSFGVAIDLNAEWNGYGARPQAAGLHGSVRELVPFFAHSGFAWGGHFSGASTDGMHFELAVY